MALDDSERLKDLFSAFGPISIRRMFGGAGIFADGTMFALMADGDLYFKADEETIPAFRAAGVGPFIYTAKGRRVVMSYWLVPDPLLDDQEEFAQWARAALRVAQRAATIRPPRRASPTRTRKSRRH